MPARTKTLKRKANALTRASWKGNLTFGLVTFSVHAVNALNRSESDIHFHQLHAKCHRRIQYKKVCPLHGEVSQDEIVAGYEFKKGKYVEITDEELDSVKAERERSLAIDTFIAPDAIDPMYFDGRMYFLVPDGDSALAPYSVVLQAMKREERFGIGTMVLSGKEQLALLRPLDSILQLAMINYDEEIRTPKDVMSTTLPRPDSRQMKLAQSLIKNWSSDDFDFGKYDDEYRERVKRLIAAKARGQKVEAPEEDVPPEVINLMDALKQSLAKGHPSPSKRKAKTTRRKTG